MAKGEGKKSIGKIILIVVIVLIVIGAIGSMAGGNGGSSDQSSSNSSNGSAPAQTQQADQNQDAQKPAEPFTISDAQLDTSNPYAVKVNGTLVNNTDSDKSYVQVSYTLYDASGAQIGTALANTNNLKAGGTWKFSALGSVSGGEVAKFELGDVTGF